MDAQLHVRRSDIVYARTFAAIFSQIGKVNRPKYRQNPKPRDLKPAVGLWGTLYDPYVEKGIITSFIFDISDSHTATYCSSNNHMFVLRVVRVLLHHIS